MPKGQKPSSREYKPVAVTRSSKGGGAPTTKMEAKKFHPRDPRYAKQSSGVYMETHAPKGKRSGGGTGSGRGK